MGGVSIAVAVVAGFLTAAALCAGVGVAGAGHGPEGSNFTYTPLSADDREPGASETRVGQMGQAAAGVDTDFETLLRLWAVWRAGSWEGCGPGSAGSTAAATTSRTPSTRASPTT